MNLGLHLYFHGRVGITCCEMQGLAVRQLKYQKQSFLQIHPSRSIPNDALFATISQFLYFGAIPSSSSDAFDY